MPEQNLPKEYMGFSTKELLAVLKMRTSGQPLEGIPQSKIKAMNRLAREYLLTPDHQAAHELKNAKHQKAA